MGETAEERKARLLALREGAAATQNKELKFRNYLPNDEVLQAGQVRVPPFFTNSKHAFVLPIPFQAGIKTPFPFVSTQAA